MHSPSSYTTQKDKDGNLLVLEYYVCRCARDQAEYRSEAGEHALGGNHFAEIFFFSSLGGGGMNCGGGWSAGFIMKAGQQKIFSYQRVVELWMELYHKRANRSIENAQFFTISG